MKQILGIFGASLALISCSFGGTNNNRAPATAPEVRITYEDPTSVFDRLTSSDSLHMFSSQRLTSAEAMLSAFSGPPEDFLHEKTPVQETFFFPGPGIREDSLTRSVQLRYNYANVFNQVNHAYEWFRRISSSIDPEELTYQDTLKFIRESQPLISQSLLRRALPDDRAYKTARKLLDTYRAFDGDDSEGSPLSTAMSKYGKGYETLPEIVSLEELREFQTEFWEWYDKRHAESEIDIIVKTHLKDSEAGLDSLQVERLKEVVMGEIDSDRRAVLALELAQIDGWNGAILLGDLIESGIYTKYLLEVWISWRAHAQMNHSPSSFSIIANNYFDQLRVKCLNTLLARIQEEQDFFDPESDDTKQIRCMIENMILTESVHRQGSIVGNDSFSTCMHLAYDMFIDPRLLEEQ